MNVKLLKQEEVGYSLTEDKCDKIGYKTLCMLTDYKECAEEDNSPKMVAFKTKDEFNQNAWKYDIDTDKEVLISQKGIIFCYIKEEPKTAKKSNAEDVPADTDKN